IASLQAARGALSSVTAMAKGKHLVSPSPPIATLFEGALITYATVVASGYPRADSGLANAAGLGSIDYTLVAAGSAATANSPATSFTEVAFIPVSVAGSPAGLTCFVKYTEPATATGSPSFTVFTSGC
ncbi:hypothetical protein, partial [Undibacterium sp.]|uniref:hypothetical protein n=1 Tax=Undibacterium sp. TaxID=1914977 RepID=UPI003753AA4A